MNVSFFLALCSPVEKNLVIKALGKNKAYINKFHIWIDLNVYLNICHYMYLFTIVMKYVQIKTGENKIYPYLKIKYIL